MLYAFLRREYMVEEKNNEELRHLVRIMNTDLQGAKPVEYALTGIPGIGRRTARLIAKGAGVDPTATLGYLPEEEVAKLDDAIGRIEEIVPSWMLNRRKDLATGQDKHLLGTDILLTFREDINILKKIRAYRGLRHERGLKVRGQRTKSTGRRGATVGVSRKK
ncbi:MAG: 30S ribosomal protein S13 [Phycisphaerae bacterium]|mgnify:CR=1 FL=1|jgi:small subunit ribosomal protein S13|uniref:Small ribosomal subunit protein uS13 n=3 Tax=Methanosarcina thermophila TaxID=2210 RepID=A0A0E3NHL6_METTE|nr:30S ribosomal protein S13 [Methanosarcina thermophila]AKB12894.1 SSU ribosomal protein S18e (S13p) [Methanosarcina thermophila TM-1]AKB16485.1 SSU ribosomal protein S18e (S13p) [Methanosarcina thermophila CHTI-55]NLU56922.1 30S ribosomal protein S13 [Methanosarcina thermophila]HOA68182.1 30S ribosomal protein S13 [Methanosarcina thermophila]HOQ65108.1 30S ribosomal protein S13 [Methanosarcina thermophila]